MKNARFTLLVAGLFFMSACGDENGTETDTSTDDGVGPDACVGCGEPYEATFLITTLHIGTIDQGFNLDGEYTRCTDGSCIVDGNNGVDNRLREILLAVENAINEPINADEEIDRNILDGNMLVLLRMLDVEVTGMASLTSSDPDIRMKGYMGVDTDDPEDPTDNFSGSEPFDVDPLSLSDPLDVESSLIDFTDCHINAGKLRCSPSLFKLELGISGSPLDLSIIDSQVVCTFETSPSNDGSGNYTGGSMKECILGGYVPVRLLQDALNELADELGDISPAQVQQILANHADIDATLEGPTDTSCPNGDECLSWQTCRDGICHEPPDQPDAISLAVTFEAVSVVFTGDIAPAAE